MTDAASDDQAAGQSGPLPAHSDRLPLPDGAGPQVAGDRERLYLALLDLAPQFVIRCRPSGALRDITVSRHRRGPDSPWQWAIHRLGVGLTTFAWTGTGWTVVDDPARMLPHAVWTHPLHAIGEAQRLADGDVARGHTEVEQ